MRQEEQQQQEQQLKKGRQEGGKEGRSNRGQGGLYRRAMGERHLSNQPKEQKNFRPVSSRALLKGFYQCIYSMATRLSMSEQSPKNSAFSNNKPNKNTTAKNTLLFLLLFPSRTDRRKQNECFNTTISCFFLDKSI